MSEHLREGWGRLIASRKTASPPTSWRPVVDTNHVAQSDAVILTQYTGNRRFYEVYTYGVAFGNYPSLEGAKAAIEEIYHHVSWQRVSIPKVEVYHYFFGPTTEFSDPTVMYVADLPRLGSKTASDYWGGHRPTRDGAPAHDLLASDQLPKDAYDKPQYYTGFAQFLPETMRVLKAARGNPSAQVTIYRSLPPNKPQVIGTGDWVTLSRPYAEMHGEGRGYEEWVEPKNPDAFKEGEGWVQFDDDWPVVSASVPASTVRFAGDDLMEWGYWGESDQVTEVPYRVEANRDSYYATCQHAECEGFRSRKKGSRDKAIRAVSDHIRDVHGGQ